jgi:hypothetical protein
VIVRELALAGGYAAFLAACAGLFELSASHIKRGAASDGGKLPWPQSDAAALRRVFAATLLVLAVFILAVAVLRAVRS